MVMMERITNDDFLNSDVTEFALDYDKVKFHTWYDNLNYLVTLSKEYFNENDLIMDYSCGTGIFSERLLNNMENIPNILMMDASPKYLKLSYEKFKENDKFLFRLMSFLKDENRLQTIKESIGEDKDGFLNGIICTNAIHLYPNVESTVKEWCDSLVSGGKLLINSGNILNGNKNIDSVLIDQTVNDIAERSYGIVMNSEQYGQYLDLINNFDYINKHNDLRDKYFLPIKPIEYYTDIIENNGFKITEIRTDSVNANVDEWFDFLKVYHEGIIGWVGGSKKITGVEPTDEDINNRIEIIKTALNLIFENKETFKASWNYIICEKI
jgi:ubiquinone/menaquinone biosynthesis C-methylase UbiE